MINSTFYGNTATGDAGTLGISDYVFVDVYNSIFWNEDVTYEISGYASYSTLYHSLVQPMGDDGYDGLWNTGVLVILMLIPLFNDTQAREIIRSPQTHHVKMQESQT